jgi:hypothetical protein
VASFTRDDVAVLDTVLRRERAAVLLADNDDG